MLCVSAVNPYLYSRVPILSHVKETRRKLNKLLACIVCPGRARILQKMGSRRYLMENNDFFALQDLEDLSKGAFAVLPSVLKNVLDTLKMHIMKQCSVCSEAGEWCGAGVLCEEPFSPIFPFEEENITNCKVCHAPFHKACFSKLSACPACRGDQSNKSVMAGVSDTFQTEELAENIRDVTLLLGGEDGNASSSLAGGADLQGGFELDRQSHTRKNWPSFYSLLPKPRLW
ncbi:hypothetical protein L7F22_016342 [Adiantum nelumboides]|nr:hypothetical protein [Adiantum nelumboides]